MKLTVEVVSNIRTVASLGREEMFYNQYMDMLNPAIAVCFLLEIEIICKSIKQRLLVLLTASQAKYTFPWLYLWFG